MDVMGVRTERFHISRHYYSNVEKGDHSSIAVCRCQSKGRGWKRKLKLKLDITDCHVISRDALPKKETSRLQLQVHYPRGN